MRSSSDGGAVPTHSYFCLFKLTTMQFINVSLALECLYMLLTVVWFGRFVVGAGSEQGDTGGVDD